MEELNFKLKKIILPYLIALIITTLCYVSFNQFAVLEYDLFNKIEWKYSFTLEQQTFFSIFIFCLPAHFYMRSRIGFLKTSDFWFYPNWHFHWGTTFYIGLILLVYSAFQAEYSRDELKLIDQYFDKYWIFLLFLIFFLFVLIIRILRSELIVGSCKENNPKYEQFIRKLGSAYRIIRLIIMYLFSATLFLALFIVSYVVVMKAYGESDYSLILWMTIPFMMSGAFLYVLINGHKLPLNLNSLDLSRGTLAVYKTYTLKDFNGIISAISEQNNEKSFLVFILDKGGLNIQLSIKNKKLGVDWVLISEGNIKDKDLFIKTVKEFGCLYEEVKSFNLKYIRVEESKDFVALTKNILIKMYHVNEKTEFETIIEGFEHI